MTRLCAKVESWHANLTYPNVHTVHTRDISLEHLETYKFHKVIKSIKYKNSNMTPYLGLI